MPQDGVKWDEFTSCKINYVLFLAFTAQRELLLAGKINK